MDALQQFASVAREYCDLTEQLLAGERPERLYTILEGLLPRLLVAINPIWTGGGPDEDDPSWEALRMTTEEFQPVSRMFGGLLGPDTDRLMAEYERLVPEGASARYDKDITRAFMLFDDLADMYRDLLNGLKLWDLGGPEARKAAQWEWRWGYQYHWGEHATRAMRTIHDLRYLVIAEDLWPLN
jgi:hypothetical protein